MLDMTTNVNTGISRLVSLENVRPLISIPSFVHTTLILNIHIISLVRYSIIYTTKVKNNKKRFPSNLFYTVMEWDNMLDESVKYP